MKICLVNNLFKPYEKGGAERIVDITANELLKMGEVFIVSTKPGFRTEVKIVDNLKIYYLPSLYFILEKIPVFFRIFWHIFDVFDFITAFRVLTAVKNEKPDFVVTHNLKGISYLLPLLLYLNKIKHAHLLHDVQIFYPSGLMMYKNEYKTKKLPIRVYSFFTSLLFNKVLLVFCPSEWLMNEHIRNGFFKKSKKVILRNPVNLLNLPKKEKSGIKFIFVGQVEKYKGINTLLHAFKKLLVDYPDSELKVIGVGGDLRGLINVYKNVKEVIFTGRLNKDEVLDEMLSSSCIVVPSLCYENSPTVLYEAASCSLPVIASNLGGNIELVNIFGGLLFEPGDEYDLYLKMKKFIENQDVFNEISRKYSVKVREFNSESYVIKLINELNFLNLQ